MMHSRDKALFYFVLGCILFGTFMGMILDYLGN